VENINDKDITFRNSILFIYCRCWKIFVENGIFFFTSTSCTSCI